MEVHWWGQCVAHWLEGCRVMPVGKWSFEATTRWWSYISQNYGQMRRQWLEFLHNIQKIREKCADKGDVVAALG